MIGGLEGRYRVLQKLGEGAMGEVYLAEHVGLGRREALKILRLELASTPDLVARFRREARAMNRLNHPNIVSVYDFGRLSDGRLYLTSEYAGGENLDSLIARHGTLPIPRVLLVLSQLADAIDHAHARGVIHRDLKPANMVLVERRGQVDVLKVLDFGVAKVIAPDYDDSVGVTRQGSIFGTPAYMAPEQTRGEGNDPRIDIYAAGCIGWHMLVGRPPFEGRPLEVMHKHSTEPAAPASQFRSQRDVPSLLDDVLLRCMEKDPERRFPSGKSLANLIRQVPGFPRDKTGSGRRSHRRIPLEDFATAQSEFDAIDTDVFGLIHLDDGETLDVGIEAEPLTDEEATLAVQALLRGLAETLADVGCRDFQLVMGLAKIGELEVEIERFSDEVLHCEQLSEQIERRERERESSLRFAIGELRFERDQAVVGPGGSAGDVDEQIRELERRLWEVLEARERELAKVTDQAIELVAKRAGEEEKLAELYSGLERLVMEIVPRFRSHPAVIELLSQLDRARAAAERARGLGPA